MDAPIDRLAHDLVLVLTSPPTLINGQSQDRAAFFLHLGQTIMHKVKITSNRSSGGTVGEKIESISALFLFQPSSKAAAASSDLDLKK